MWSLQCLFCLLTLKCNFKFYKIPYSTAEPWYGYITQFTKHHVFGTHQVSKLRWSFFFSQNDRIINAPTVLVDCFGVCNDQRTQTQENYARMSANWTNERMLSFSGSRRFQCFVMGNYEKKRRPWRYLGMLPLHLTDL